MNNFKKLLKKVEDSKARSAWAAGVREYALALLDELGEAIQDGYYTDEDIQSPRALEKMLLTGADSWTEYSYGGCALVYDRDIAMRLCTPSELERTKHGQRQPNGREQWIDTQARALYQAAALILRSVSA